MHDLVKHNQTNLLFLFKMSVYVVDVTQPILTTQKLSGIHTHAHGREEIHISA